MNTFHEINLIAPLQKALAEEQYSTPTPIQAKTIPPALQGKDVLGCAQTGTGKTAAFALPILNRLGLENRKPVPGFPQVLVLAPTRELAIQIGENINTYGRHLRVSHALIYGGVNQTAQVKSLQRGVHILVATPGRLLDLMSQGHVKLSKLDVFVLDEADRMMDMGFLPDVKRVIRELPRERQSLFFSATLAPKIVELAQSMLKNPVSVNVTPASRSVDLIEQHIVAVDRKSKQAMLQHILSRKQVGPSIVFTRTKRGANAVAGKLLRSGISAAAIHGNKSQNARQRALDAFRSREIQVLVATDVAARGIDIEGITHVINFDLPMEPEAYVHRIGRTGRAGAAGAAISFCSMDEREQLQAIEQLLGHKIPRARVRLPDGSGAQHELAADVDSNDNSSTRSSGQVSRSERTEKRSRPGRRRRRGGPAGEGIQADAMSMETRERRSDPPRQQVHSDRSEQSHGTAQRRRRRSAGNLSAGEDRRGSQSGSAASNSDARRSRSRGQTAAARPADSSAAGKPQQTRSADSGSVPQQRKRSRRRRGRGTPEHAGR